MSSAILCKNRALIYKVVAIQIIRFPVPLQIMVADSGTLDTSGGLHRVLILVVERNPAVQKLERYFLEQAGYAVEFANDGLIALQRARELKPELLIAEILVPQLDGLSLCRALKADASTAHILVLIFSHLHAEDRARDAGADAYLIKPLNEDLLIETVQKLINMVSDKKGTSK